MYYQKSLIRKTLRWLRTLSCCGLFAQTLFLLWYVHLDLSNMNITVLSLLVCSVNRPVSMLHHLEQPVVFSPDYNTSLYICQRFALVSRINVRTMLLNIYIGT